MVDRIAVKKTYKLYINGAFPRSESGQVAPCKNRKGQHVASYCRASRKDLRDAVTACQGGLVKWKAATPYLRGQILYRAAEMLEDRSSQFVEELQLQDLTRAAARKEVVKAVDRLVHYAGWTDKVGSLFSTVNPVASPHFCFTVPEPTGVVAILLGPQTGFAAMVDSVARILAGGNAAILLAGTHLPLSASTLGEIWHTSDLPGGTLNILTGPLNDLSPVAASHRAIDGILGLQLEDEREKSIQETASDSLKRLRFIHEEPSTGSPYAIRDFLEMKTTWHPVGI